MLAFPLLYAEIHYHFPFLYPRYYRKEPEIIIDAPIRVCGSRCRNLPIVLIIKDANLFPIVVNELEVKIFTKARSHIVKIPVEKSFNNKYESQIFSLNIEAYPLNEWLLFAVKIHYECNGKSKSIWMDNYGTKIPFRTYLEEQALPYPANWYAGDPHYHSNFTEDQVEFGADIKTTREIALCMGLDWFFVTDHSYDLDDKEDNFLVQDPLLTKWVKMKTTCRQIDSKKCRVIHGEEISIGNKKNENVHLLAINQNQFIYGSGDSAERWFRNKPEHLLFEIAQQHKQENLFIAAHPHEKVPFLQRLTLNRGNWQSSDYKQARIRFLQLINGHGSIKKMIEYWRNLLLEGKKIWLVAGNDAHGNFNFMRQIKIPFWNIFAEKRQLFGKFHTVFFHTDNNPIVGFKKGCIIVSNGPFLNFTLADESENCYSIGEVYHKSTAIIQFERRTTQEFGDFSECNYFIGNLATQKEKKYKLTKRCIIKLPSKGYIRCEAKTKKDGIVITNPIWIDYSFTK